jgi:hypothetical protein
VELDSFIKETLTQISRGVRLANEELDKDRKSLDGKELPKIFLLRPGSQQERGAGVAFDVAVTTHTEDSGNGGARVKLAVVEANIGGKISTSQQNVSRIQFAINVVQWHG